MALIYTLKSTVRTFPRTLFRGIGQVMFQDSMWTGILFTIGIFWGAYEEGIGIVAWGLLLGAIVSTLTGYILQLPDTKEARVCGDSTDVLSDAHSLHFSGIRSGCGSD